MQLKQRLAILTKLREHLTTPSPALQAAINRTKFENQWFTNNDIKHSLAAITNNYLSEEKLRNWLANYDLPENTHPKIVGLVMAGNLPLVGFHDFLTVFISGHKAQIKLSSKDKRLLPYIISTMIAIDERVKDYIEIVERLKGFEAVIATGSNNSARYFDYYFGKYPNVIRKNRNSVAVLTGNETPEELIELGKDIFQYYGLGCRNVSKIMVPVGFDFVKFMDGLQAYQYLMHHNKYKNNFDYQLSLLLLNKEKHFSSHHLLLVERKNIASAVSVLHYEFYEKEQELADKIIDHQAEIQCVVGDAKKGYIPFGKAQMPELWDYADKVDTLDFLLKLH